MAALCAATAIIAVVVPFAAGLSLLGTVPMGLLAYRYRLRVFSPRRWPAVSSRSSSPAWAAS